MSYVNQNIEDMTNNYSTRFANIKNYILYSLGWPLVKIELMENHINLAICEALTKYYKNAALDYNLVVAPVNGGLVDIPIDINKAMISDVVIPASTLDSYARGFGAQISDEFGVYNMSTEYSRLLLDFDMARYYMYTQRLEDFRNLTGTKPGWIFLNGKIQLTPTDIEANEVGIIYKRMSSDEDIDQQDWIKDYALARATLMLGHVRSKFSGFQSSNANIAVDGEALKSQAREDLEKLNEKLNGMRAPLPILKG